MPGTRTILLIPEPSWQEIAGLEDALKGLDIPTERGTLEDLAPAITPFDLASLRAFLDRNKLNTVNDPTPVELDYEKRLWYGETKSIGALYHGPSYCSYVSDKLLENDGASQMKHPVVVTPRILAEYTDRVHARTFFAFWPTVISIGGMTTALVKDQSPLTQDETNRAIVKNILSSLLHVYRDEPFCFDPTCFHSNPHTIGEVRKRNQSNGCQKHEMLLKEILRID